MKIAIIGAGNFGTAIAFAMSQASHQIVVYDVVKSRVDDINTNHTNSEVFPNLILSNTISAKTYFDSYLSTCDLVCLVVSSSALTIVLEQIASLLNPNAVILNLSKGFDQSTGNTLDQVYYQQLGLNILFGVAAGPTFASLIVQGDPSSLVLGTKHEKVETVVRQAFAGSNISISRTDDIKGLEICSAVKNIMAIATGIHNGIKMGYNSKFTLLTGAVREVLNLVVAVGGTTETIFSVAGIGDLMMTATSENSRNYRFGSFLGQGITIPLALEKVGSTVEGLEAIKPTLGIAEKYNIKMPIVQAVYNIIFANSDPIKELQNLF